jgi:hypothetical protein
VKSYRRQIFAPGRSQTAPDKTVARNAGSLPWARDLPLCAKYPALRAKGILSSVVRDPSANAGGLCLDSTATRRSVAAAPLWLHRPTHRGVLTKHPYWPSPAGPAAFGA